MDRKSGEQWLKRAHKLGHVTAQFVVASAGVRGNIYEDETKLVEDLLGGKAAQRAIYEAVLRAVEALPGAKPKSCKTYVPFSRGRQFALVKPVGRTDVELHLALGDAAAKSTRLARGKARAARMSHAVRLSVPDDVDDEVRDWLKRAHAAA